MKKNIKIGVFIAIIFLLFALMGLIIVLCYIPKSISGPISYDFVISFIGTFIAIANAMLLYATLTSQNRGISNQEVAFHQERFETTFFNLLEYHRKLADELRVCVKVLNQNIHIDNIELRGRSFFHFAINEIKLIQESIEAKYYRGPFDEWNDRKSLEAIEQKYRSIDSEGIMYRELERELNENYHFHRIKLSNSIYNITEDRWATHHSCENTKPLSYEIFSKVYYAQYEQYMRSIKALFTFAGKESNKNYIDFVNAQMTKDELEFVKLHSLADNTFKNLKSLFG